MRFTKNTEVSLEELAAITGRSKSWLNKLAADGYFKSERHGTYRIGNAIAGLLRHGKEDKRSAAQTSAAVDVQKARAEQIRLRTAREAGDLVTHQFHTDIIGLIVGDLVAFLNGLPARLTRDPKLRSEYEATIGSERLRLCEQWERLASEDDANDGEEGDE
ncbi:MULTISPECIES: hypothetical protein [unclassified Bradyrhizobium]|uniref:hypothetical protein n=1 Tax=unclassified Bradyrhizobium TaxID=2631580 RepID=UPI0028EC1CCB|nr:MULTISPECIES: hypothetical protein [unclassified Bradyrhizobium]